MQSVDKMVYSESVTTTRRHDESATPADHLVEHYREFYSMDRDVLWRELGARAKAKNIVDVWEAAYGQTDRPVSAIEIGCGTGDVLRRLAAMKFAQSYAGYDLSADAIADAARNTTQADIHWATFDGRRLPSENGAFDVAILSHVIEHAADPRGLLAEAFRVAPIIVAEVPLEAHWRSPAHFHWSRTGHINFFTVWSFRQLLESALAPRQLRVLAERITTPGLSVYQYRSGAVRGSLTWAVKSSMLSVWPRLATRISTYHATMLVALE